MSIELTDADVGRKVKLRNGNVFPLEYNPYFAKGVPRYPYFAGFRTVDSHGCVWSFGSPDDHDVVAFADAALKDSNGDIVDIYPIDEPEPPEIPPDEPERRHGLGPQKSAEIIAAAKDAALEDTDVYEYDEPGCKALDVAKRFTVKDSGARQSFASGMVRDTTENKTDWHRVADGPMLERWAEHLTKGKYKYEDVAPGKPNWTLAAGDEERERFRQSAFRHFMAWFHGNEDEDHAAAVFFNINGAEYVKEQQTRFTTSEAA